MSNLDYPFAFDASGRTATTGDDDHLRDMLEQLLFTDPGERVNRPDFGTGLRQLVFAPNGGELATAVKFTIQSAIQRQLGDLIELRSLETTSEDSTLTVVIRYVVRRTNDARVARFNRPVAP